jgi:hypothetical protein
MLAINVKLPDSILKKAGEPVGGDGWAPGFAGPIVAAILHNVGSFIVIFNSARLVRKGEELEHYHPHTETPASGDGGSRHEAARQLEPKVA